MKKTIFSIITAAIFFAGTVFFHSCEEEKPLVVTGNIEGTVSDFETTIAIPAVVVDIVSNSSTTFIQQSRQTGNDGKFSFKDIEAGNYKLSFSRSGYNTNSINVNVAAGSTASADVTLSPSNNILTVAPQTVDFGEVETEKSIIVQNNGLETVPYEATSDKSWLTLSNAQGSIAKGGSKIIQLTVNRAGLNPGEYTANVVINSNNTSLIVPVQLKMVQPSAPTVQIGQANVITSNSAQISGNIISLGSSAVTEYGHCWSTSPDPTTVSNKTAFGTATTTQSFTSNITGLSPNTTYYVKAYAINSLGTSYSDAVTFTTLAPPTMATVQTLSAPNVGHNSIDATGNITVLGDGLVTDHGFCYSTSNATPTISDSKASKGQTTQTGQFTVTISQLQASTKYYIRAYATNSMGTAYGTVIEATTTDAPPVVTSGLVAYYTFDNQNCNEAQGNTQYNGIQQGNGSPVWSTDIPNKSGRSLQLSNDAYFRIATAPITYLSQFSYSVWLKVNQDCVVFTGYSTNNAIILGTGFVGKMDNLRFYKRELVQSEITEIYNAKQ
ncbi:MAG: carboxypeptidase regulatory-like domain-containing protein [Candidatus Symbiothrix sp.]|nr:carboxypeptidase regulatory-like domain-containing protein [Candidatus Symbiothrix sp.]